MTIGKMTQLAMQVFKKQSNVNAVKKVLPSGTEIKIFREGANGLQKVITKPNSITISHLTENGAVTGIRQVTQRGEINYSFGAQNYNKVVQVNPKIGGKFTLLGHTNKPQNGILYSNMSGRYEANNKYMKQFKEALDYIRGKDSAYLYSLSKANKGI